MAALRAFPQPCLIPESGVFKNYHLAFPTPLASPPPCTKPHRRYPLHDRLSSHHIDDTRFTIASHHTHIDDTRFTIASHHTTSTIPVSPSPLTTPTSTIPASRPPRTTPHRRYPLHDRLASLRIDDSHFTTTPHQTASTILVSRPPRITPHRRFTLHDHPASPRMANHGFVTAHSLHPHQSLTPMLDLDPRITLDIGCQYVDFFLRGSGRNLDRE